MQIEQKQWTVKGGWQSFGVNHLVGAPQLVLVFGAVDLIPVPDRYAEISQMYPGAHVLMCSTAGEILGTTVSEQSLALTALYFEKTTLNIVALPIAKSDESMAVGQALAGVLPKEGLAHVMVFSDGLKANGTDLVAGLVENLPKTVAVTGGLVGGGNKFEHTFIGLDEVPQEGKIVAIGFYGNELRVRYGAVGGWDVFGPKRLITKAKKNVLYELDNRPALALYKEYLGEKANELPGSGLLFPLSLDIKNESDNQLGTVRTILAVDETEQSITFAGDMPEGVMAQMMKANFDRLIGGAADAASMVLDDKVVPSLAILISCVGRKLVLNDRIEEETEAVQRVLGSSVTMTGFYSYGELSPFTPTQQQCRLHNQTMTITTFSEIE